MADSAPPSRPVYLDNQATTPCDPRVLTLMLPWFSEDYGNPHSEHAMGRRAEEAIERARAQVAALIGADPDEIVFTSGATEANNLAVLGIARAAPPERRRIAVSAIEHKCVLASAHAVGAESFEII
ncbi:MAG: aminotransferase class V-fold PLP-dependent enzyme, partial [Acetobacteraceae bacterium]|nr:aminotransferase class V-fold PLP-dependent enzyme [Acetobacteraceae bacterium]